MIRFYLILWMVVYCISIYAQGQGGQGAATSNTGVASMSNPSIPYELYATSLKKGQEYQDVELLYTNYGGSPFINDPDTYGQLELNNGNIVANVPIQYDAYRGEVIVTQKDGGKIALNSRYYRKLQLTVDGVVVPFVKAHPGQPNTFYQMLVDHPEVSLFKQVTAELIQGKTADIASTEPFFRKRKSYYIKLKEAVGAVKLKKKDFFKFFDAMAITEMEKILKKNKWKLKKEADYVRLLRIFLEE